MRKSRLRRRPMSEINVVPYIDVMLVLLVIFMVTAPLITQGVKVDLPKADAEVISAETSEPVVITVDQFGDLYLDLGEDKNQPVDPETLMVRVSAVLKYNPERPHHGQGRCRRGLRARGGGHGSGPGRGCAQRRSDHGAPGARRALTCGRFCAAIRGPLPPPCCCTWFWPRSRWWAWTGWLPSTMCAPSRG